MLTKFSTFVNRAKGWQKLKEKQKNRRGWRKSLKSNRLNKMRTTSKNKLQMLEQLNLKPLRAKNRMLVENRKQIEDGMKSKV